ncbi:Protein MODIFIER OF SNC1 1 [Auxenochlorella protothecoides]|uniref:Protein MODIFIER OF SNC1 1 n=1 Tax=Auxenochlorella protothecoides TaxID=3075 RepID=A0A087SMP8_AUXPR|nr:Protein MODIFIER OF SNC1 1 [Auxenochlorella protothecoides]KFM27002.1 Protein MODIFIER OF SNC1 1 [Auxenochlorella protothecoides]
MVSLGKVSAPKPVNLPSQRKENNGNDPSIDLVRKSANGGWGAASGATESPTASSCSEQQAANLTSEPRSANGEGIPSAVAPSRVIPAGPTPAWGGLGMPEERKRAMEQASREQFPTLDALPRCSGGVRERRLESQDFRRTEEYVEQARAQEKARKLAAGGPRSKEGVEAREKAGSRSQRRNRPAKAGAGEIAGAAVPADRGPADSPTPGP